MSTSVRAFPRLSSRDTEIGGATSSTYTLQASDASKVIKVRLSFTDDAGNDETLTSAATDAVAPTPNSPATGAPTISGTAQVGETLTADTTGVADADGLTNATFNYQWLADNAAIAGATGSTSNLFWSWKGHVISMLTSRGPDADTSSFLDLSLAEQLIYLKYYLEGDGAILIALARELVSRGGLTEDDLVRSDLLEQSLRSIWTAYSDLSTSITERVRLRERLRRQRYDATTRRHKTYPHLLPLEDIGLLVRVRTNGRDEFAPSVYDGRTPLQTIVDAFPTIGDMENSLDDNQHSSILADAIVPEHRPFSQQSDFNMLIQNTVECYQTMSRTGAMICPIDAISDVCFARMLSQQQVLVPTAYCSIAMQRKLHAPWT